MDKKTIITPIMLLAYAYIKKLIEIDGTKSEKRDKIKTFEEFAIAMNNRLKVKPYKKAENNEQLQNVNNALEQYITDNPPPPISDEVKMDKYALEASNYLKAEDFIGDASSTDFIRNLTITGTGRDIQTPQIDQAVSYEQKLRSAEIGRKQAVGRKKAEIERITAERYDMEAERDKQKAKAIQRKSTITEQEQKLEKKKRKVEEQKAMIASLEDQLRIATDTKNKGLEKEVRKLLKTKSTALRKGEKEFTELKEQLGQIDQKITTVDQKMDSLRTQIEALPRTIKGTQREIIQPREYKYDEGRTGLGLNPSQRKKLKAIVAKETRPDIAEAVDMIAGDEIKASPSQIMTALTGIALSVAIPIPSPVMSAIIERLSRETGFDTWFNSMFEDNRISDSNNRILTQRATVNSLQQIEQAMPGAGVEAKTETIETKTPYDFERKVNEQFEQAVMREVLHMEGKQIAGPGSIDLGGKADQKQQRDNRGRFRRIADTQAGAVLGGATTYAITGSVASAVTGAGVGGLVGALSPAISRIGEALAERLPDTIPTTTGIQRAVQRQITTDTKDVNIPIPKVARRPANEQETAITYNRLDELDNEYNDLRNRQRRLEADMMSNVNSGVSNTQLGLTQLARATSQQIRENRDNALRLQDDIDNARLRIDIDRKGVGIPIPRRTTDDEKALVPFNEAEERTTYDKKKALAVAGAVGSAVVVAGVERSGMFKERPIEVPTEIFSQQQDQAARGLLRPKFIMPSADILQPSNQELAADALEFAMFDFVEPSSEGAEGTNQTNILKAFQKENENIRYRGAGVVVNSLFNNDANDLTTEQITKMFLGPPIPPMVFTEIQQNLSEYEVNSFDVNNERTGVEFFSPYNNFTDVNPGLNENISLLFDIVP
jgi:hypothetical protein